MGLIVGRAEVLILAAVIFGGGGLESVAASSHQESGWFPGFVKSWAVGLTKEAASVDDGDRC